MPRHAQEKWPERGLAERRQATNPAGRGLGLTTIRKVTTCGPGKLIRKDSCHTEVGLQGVTRWICPALSATAPISRKSLWPAKKCSGGVANAHGSTVVWPGAVFREFLSGPARKAVGWRHVEFAGILQRTGCPSKHSTFRFPA